MKKLLIGLLTLGSISAFAETNCHDALDAELASIPSVRATLDRLSEDSGEFLRANAIDLAKDSIRSENALINKIKSISNQVCPGER